jgi:hypothetical protein
MGFSNKVTPSAASVKSANPDRMARAAAEADKQSLKAFGANTTFMAIYRFPFPTFNPDRPKQTHGKQYKLVDPEATVRFPPACQ